MGQSLAQVYIHLIFSTKNREPWLVDDFRNDLHQYIAGILADLESPPVLINSVTDHVHVLLCLSRTISLAKLAEDVKKGASRWISSRLGRRAGFAWQTGYGAFSVSASRVPVVTDYIRRQPEHHSTRSFKEELLALLDRHGVEYDERFLWA
jgi:REP element-mobilizing transposase RayT